MNILIPMAGQSQFFQNQPFPKPLIEVQGIPMIQRVLEYLTTLKREKKFIYILNQLDCATYHLDNTLRLLTKSPFTIIQQTGDAKGAACSCLLAIDHIDNSEPLIISNSDQFIDQNIEKIIEYFEQKEADAGVICFESVHPKWSYVRVDSNDNVVETEEKNPISKMAIAGFYYFREGRFFVEAAKKMILNNAHVNDLFFIAPAFNELILAGKKIRAYQIKNEDYHSFYSLEKIAEFEKSRQTRSTGN